MIGRLWELIVLFFKIGATSFGGPAVYIAIMEDETVRRRQWLSREHFVDLLGATNLIPGPNATEVALYIGYHRAGPLGMLATAVAYITPSMVISGLLAWGYVNYGGLPDVQRYLWGVKPVVLGILVAALGRLSPVAFKSWQTWLVGVAVIAVALFQADPVATLFTATILGAVLLRLTHRAGPPTMVAGLAAAACTGGKAALAGEVAVAAGGAAVAATVPLWQIGLYFLKIGAVLYGSGYVIVAYIQGDLVNELHWLTEQQLVDAVAAGQITPGPFVSTASFIGHFKGGWTGNLVATLAINLPSLVFVALTSRWVARLRQSRWAGYLLDAVNAAALGLMAAVCFTLAGATLLTAASWLLALATVVVSLRWKVSPVVLIVVGAVLGGLFG